MTIATFLTSNGTTPNKIMCIGDSITLGTDATSTWLPKDGFRYRLWYYLRRAGVPAQMVGPYSDGGTYAAWDANHAGIGGTTLVTMNGNAAAWIATHTPDVVLILGGINDLVTQTAAATITRLETLIDTIQATPTNPLIIVSTTTIHSTYITKSNDYNALLPAACTGKSVAFVDSASDISAANYMLSDTVHPSARGYEKMAPRLATGIQTLLGL
jgi:lysophospholipase L1-like esterase